MTNAKIDNELPRAIWLLFPDSYKVTITRRLRILDVGPGLPWTSRETHVAGRGHSGEVRLPCEQGFLVGRRRPRMLEQPLLPVYGAGPEQQSVVGNESQERFARGLLLRHLRKRLLRPDHLLERRLPLRDNRSTQNHKYYR